MRIAFIGHSYHATTGSNAFFVDLLRRCGEVELFYDDSWLTGRSPAWAAEFRPESFDCVAVFQMPEPLEWLDRRHPNVVFVPMLDRHYNEEHFWWRPELGAAKVVSFSATLDARVAELADVRFFVQYAPPIDALPPLRPAAPLAAYFWYRRPPIDPALLRRVTGDTVLDRFTLQLAPDPGVEATGVVHDAPLAREFVETSTWLPDRGSHLARLAEHSLYFAPRLYEGIGMSFLDAMAIGLCVVAPDTPTHNEYIAHGVNGLLYSPTRPTPVDLADCREIGERAREGAARRRAVWEAAEPDLLEFLSTPRARLAGARTLIDLWRHDPQPATPPVPAPRLPAVTAVLCGGDTTDELVRTLASLAEQDYPALDLLVLAAAQDVAPLASGARFLPPRPGSVAGDVGRRLAEALAEIAGEFVVFLRAGDRFVSSQSLRRLLADASDEVDVVHGHFVSRDDRGVEELRLVGEPRRTLSLLERRGFDSRWMERLPPLAATAFRTKTLRHCGFDPAVRCAVELDLHRRLAHAGARHRCCDAVVALCEPAATPLRSRASFASEWLRLAVRHGAPCGERRRYIGLDLAPDEAWEAVLWGWVDRARGGPRRRFVARSSRDHDAPAPRRPTDGPRLAKAVRTAARQLAKAEHLLAARWPGRMLAGRPSPGDEEDVYLASFVDGIDFRRPGRPSFVERFNGLSWPEAWGRWTDGPSVEIRFRRALPRRARVELEATAHPDVAGAPIEVSVDSAAASFFAAGDETFRTCTVELETSGRAVTLALKIPLPATSASPERASGSELRRLGLALRRLRIVDLESPQLPPG